MTDKQIIIDGVDVNALYSDQIACMNRYEVASLFIKTVERLVTKEQECEELKENLPNAITRLMGELDQLKAENKTQKETIDGFLTILDKLGKSNVKLREALTEIKEIAEKGHKEKGNLMRTWWFKDILQKISEVEDANI